MTVERLQLMGSGFGMKPSFERMHWIIDHAFVDGDGTLSCGSSVSDSFLMRAFERTNTRTNPLYWTLQEFIYADGDTMPIRWAAAEEKVHRAEFDTLARPLMFTGEAMFPWMFEQMPELKPFKPAMDLLMEDTSWDKIYDPQRLACNEVPLQAAVYFDDMYVDSGLQLDTLSHVGNSHAWVTNEFEHDGLHGSVVFKHLFDEASTAETCVRSSSRSVPTCRHKRNVPKCRTSAGNDNATGRGQKAKTPLSEQGDVKEEALTFWSCPTIERQIAA
mgnify:CR=1 FL=1